jgi:hypothetical protein
MSKKTKPKIKQNDDVKQRATVGVRELKEYLYNKRASLTYEEIDNLINDVAIKLYEVAYDTAWNDRNEIYRVRKSEHLKRITRAFNHFYGDYVGDLPIKTMDQIRYIVDIALLNRYFNEDYTLQNQVNNPLI